MGWDRERLEQICVRNLLATPEDRVFFKDLESRFLLVSKGWPGPRARVHRRRTGRHVRL